MSDSSNKIQASSEEELYFLVIFLLYEWVSKKINECMGEWINEFG